MEQSLVQGVIFLSIDSDLNSRLVISSPPNFSQESVMRINEAIISFIREQSTESHLSSEDLLVIPFLELNLKSLVKFWHNDSSQCVLILLFYDYDDLIYYQYMDDLKPIFKNFSQEMLNLPKLEEFQTSLIQKLTLLHKDEIKKDKEMQDEFPDTKGRLDYKFKVVLCGDSRVGKTSLVLRFTHSAFKRTYLPTIGANITEKTVNVKDKIIQLIFWDVAGQLKFDKMRKNFYLGAEGLFLVFDLTNRRTLDSLSDWYNDVRATIDVNKPQKGYIIGNKNDLKDERDVSREEAEIYARKLGLEYFETSALSGENVDESFNQMAEAILSLKI